MEDRWICVVVSLDDLLLLKKPLLVLLLLHCDAAQQTHTMISFAIVILMFVVATQVYIIINLMAPGQVLTGLPERFNFVIIRTKT